MFWNKINYKVVKRKLSKIMAQISSKKIKNFKMMKRWTKNNRLITLNSQSKKKLKHRINKFKMNQMNKINIIKSNKKKH